MAALPVGKNHDAWPRLANHPRNFEPVLPGVLDVPVRDVKRMPPACAQDLRRVGCFTRSVFACTAGTHLSLGEVKNPRALATLRHLQQRATTRLLYVIAVRSNRQNIEGRRSSHFDLDGSSCRAVISFVRPENAPVPLASPPVQQTHPVPQTLCSPTRPLCATIHRLRTALDKSPSSPECPCPQSFPVAPTSE